MNLAAFGNAWRKWHAAQEARALFIYRGLAAEIFTYMVHETPQYTGEAVSNWALSSGSPVFSTGTGQKEAYKSSAPRGEREPWNKAAGGGKGPNLGAVGFSLARMREGLRTIGALKDKVYITNATPWKGGSGVTEMIEKQPGWLRPENREGEAPIMAVSFVRDRYAVLDAAGISRLVRMAT